MKKILLISLLLIIPLLTGCSSNLIDGVAKVHFKEGYQGTYIVKKLPINEGFPAFHLGGSSTSVSLSNQKYAIICKQADFSPDFDDYKLKLQVCETNQFSEANCDIQQYKLIRNGDDITIIPESCSDCKLDIDIIKAVTWEK